MRGVLLNVPLNPIASYLNPQQQWGHDWHYTKPLWALRLSTRNCYCIVERLDFKLTSGLEREREILSASTITFFPHTLSLSSLSSLYGGRDCRPWPSLIGWSNQFRVTRSGGLTNAIIWMVRVEVVVVGSCPSSSAGTPAPEVRAPVEASKLAGGGSVGCGGVENSGCGWRARQQII